MRDITNLRFGSLIVLSLHEVRKRHPYWNVICDCGCKTVVAGTHLISSHTTSCGCSRSIKVNRYNYIIPKNRHDPTLMSWTKMHGRCNDTNNKLYGGRGISVCKRWEDYTKFVSDMGERPDNTSIDRIDNNKGYYPNNCKWSTPKEQANNRGGYTL